MKIDGKTYTRCDRCRKYNVDFDKPATVVEIYNLASYSSDIAAGPSYLLCRECANKFKKAMEDFINVEGSII